MQLDIKKNFVPIFWTKEEAEEIAGRKLNNEEWENIIKKLHTIEIPDNYLLKIHEAIKEF